MTEETQEGKRIFEGGGRGATVVLVHGRHFKPRRGELLSLWREALRHGLERDRPDLAEAFRRLDLRLAYYGDLTNELLRGLGEQYDEELDIADRYHALAGLKALPSAKSFKMSRYDRLPGKSALKEFAADVSSGLIGMVGLADKVIARLSRDLAEYWNPQSDYAEAVRERVASVLTAALDDSHRVLLVSHGTGSIVAWDVLWRLSHEANEGDRIGRGKVDAWLTLGCPLGDETVKKRLLGAGEPVPQRYPTNVLTWQNVSAEDDYLCHDKDLANDFRAMMEKRLVSSIRDSRIYNLAIRYGRSNPHSSIGYLVHPRITQILVDWLQR
jgi:hypothetical protein